MSQVIQCPSCDKRFRLPPNPPATYACSGCGTVMDLSDFGGRAPAAAAAPSAPTAPSRRAGPSRGGRGRSPSRRSGSSRGGRDRDDGYDDADDGGRGRRQRPKANHTPVILLSVALLVGAVVAVIAMSSGKDEPEKPVETAGGGGTPPMGVAPSPLPGAGSPAVGLPGTGVVPVAGTPAGTGGGPAAAGGETGRVAPEGGDTGSRRRARHNANRVELQEFPWLEEVDAAIRAQAEDKIADIRRGARDGEEATKWFVQQGRPVASRLISEFKKLSDASNGFEDGPRNNEARSIAAAIDSTLRKMDGFLERTYDMQDELLRHNSPQSRVVTVAKRWTLWWEKGIWKDDPQPPWDAFVDGEAAAKAEQDALQDEAADGR